jgi:hypothetical protein
MRVAMPSARICADHAPDLGHDQRRQPLGGFVQDDQLGLASSARGRWTASAARRPRVGTARLLDRARPGAGRCCSTRSSVQPRPAGWRRRAQPSPGSRAPSGSGTRPGLPARRPRRGAPPRAGRRCETSCPKRRIAAVALRHVAQQGADERASCPCHCGPAGRRVSPRAMLQVNAVQDVAGAVPGVRCCALRGWGRA